MFLGAGGANMQSIDKRKFVSAIVAVVAILILIPDIATTIEAHVSPPAPFTYDLKVAIPPSSGLYVFPLPNYQQVKYPGLSAIYEIIESVPRDTQLSVSLEEDVVTVGGNVTFLVKIPAGKDLDVYLFLTDPRGIVRGAFPDGQIPNIAADVYPRISEEEHRAMNRGSLAYTFRIPQDPLSPGKWTIFVLVTHSLPGAARSFIAWNVATFNAVEPSMSQSAIVSALGSLGILLTVYRVVLGILLFKPITAGLAAGVRIVWKEKFFVLGLILIAVYVVLKSLA
jgi:hypothetical protein